MHQTEAQPSGGGGSGLTAVAAATTAASFYPHEAGLLLQDATTYHLGQLLCMAPRMGGHLHPRAGQPPKHLLRAAALPQQL
jgi:glycine cleavage system protein P-like pyridoxal-binding family